MEQSIARSLAYGGMSMGDKIRVLEASRRIGAASDNGCIIAVKYIVEGESGEEVAWLDEFLEEHADGIGVGDNGLRPRGGN